MLRQYFYNRPAKKVALELIGQTLIRRENGRLLKARIVETEAYDGPDDKASHASRGLTPRTKVMFGPAGRFYIYLVYGMHQMLNIVTGETGYPAAVLIRAAEPLNFAANLRGPAKLTKTMAIDERQNSQKAYEKKSGLWLEKGKPPKSIVKTARVGIDYAEEYRDKPWRYYEKGSNFISKP